MTGVWQLVRLALRRDRIMLPIWIAVFVVSAASSASTTAGFYPSVASRTQAALVSNETPALVALYGWVYEPGSLGAIAVLKLTGLGAALVALLAITMVIRHTRAEEETGRLELLGATVLGRYAGLSAALLVAVLGNLVIGTGTALGMVGAGLPVAGSVAFGLGWAGVGIAFASVAAATAQLTVSARAASGFAAAVLGAAYLLRAAGDSSAARWLSWLSPVGWAQQLRPYAHERWWVALLFLAFPVLAIAIAYALVARRDLGAGLLPDRPGPARAGRALSGPYGLAWRLQRAAFLGWALSFAVLGTVLGGVVSSADSLLDSEQARDAINRLGGGQQDLTNAFLAADLSIAGVIAAAFGVQAALRLRGEETGMRAEPVLATGVGRIRWASSHLLIALAGTTALMLITGLAAGLSLAVAEDGFARFGPVMGGALVQLPAAWVLVGIALLAFAAVPRASVAGWASLVVVLVVGEFGSLLGLSQWALDISPYAHLPRLPGGTATVTPIAWLFALAAALLAAGLVSFRQRDLTA
jgi:ABC-2 type transport system permease protein